MKSMWEKKTMSSRRNSNPIPKINLEKKTSEKIAAMTNNVLTMDFVLKNRKLLNKIKKCRVKINKMSKNRLGSKSRIPNSKKIGQKSEKHINPKRPAPKSVKEKVISSAKKRAKSATPEVKETEGKESANVVTRDKSKTPELIKKPTPEESNKKSAEKREPKEQEENEKHSEENEEKSVTTEVKEKNPPRSASKKKTLTSDSVASPRLNNRRKTASPAIKDTSEDPPAKRQKSSRNADKKLMPILDIFLDEPKTGSKDDKPKRQIFIRLPFNEISRLNGKKSKMQNKIPKINLKKLGKTYLTEKFGGRYFRSHVKLLRFYDPKKPRPQKKTKNNRKSVSFVETVEVFGESENEEESENENNPETPSAPIEDKDTSAEANKEGEGDNAKNEEVNGADFDSDDDVPLTPRKEDKFSALKAIDVLSPKSKEKRRSAEENSKNSSDEDNTPIINSVKRKVDPISSSVLIEDSNSDSVELQEVETKKVDEKEKDKENENDKDKQDEEKNNSSNKSRTIEISDNDDSEDDKNSKEDDDSVKEVRSKNAEGQNPVEIVSTDDESNDKDKDNGKKKEDNNSTKSPINGKKQVQSEDDDIFSDADDFFNDKMQLTDTPKQNQKQNDESKDNNTPQNKFSLNTFFKSIAKAVTGSPDKTKSTKNNEQSNTSSKDKEADGD